MNNFLCKQQRDPENVDFKEFYCKMEHLNKSDGLFWLRSNSSRSNKNVPSLEHDCFKAN